MTRESKLQIAEHQTSEIVVLELAGELTLDDGDIVFGKYVDALIQKGLVKIVVDLAKVTYIDSAGVGMMVTELKSVRQRGGAMKLAGLSAKSHHLFGMLKLKIVFEIFETVDAAVDSFKWGLR
jgi:anti-sigma B factor antagonist